jgi:cell division protein FtsW
VLGTGLGAGLPGVGGAPSIPAVHTDFVFAALGEELGLAGGLAILILYAIFAERGLRIAAGARDEFRTLLAAGLTLVIVVQAAIIVAGNAKLIPLTGITLPWIAYGGSSMLAGGVVLGLLLAVAVEDRPGTPSEPMGWRDRIVDGSRAVAGRVERVVR